MKIKLFTRNDREAYNQILEKTNNLTTAPKPGNLGAKSIVDMSDLIYDFGKRYKPENISNEIIASGGTLARAKRLGVSKPTLDQVRKSLKKSFDTYATRYYKYNRNKVLKRYYKL